MSEDHKDVNDLENVEEVKKVEEQPTQDLGPRKPEKKTKMNIPLVTISAIVLGALSLYGGSVLGNMLGTPNDASTDVAIESESSTSESTEEEEVVAWTPAPLIDGEPKLNQEDVVDRKVAPWSDNYKLDDTHLDYLTAEEFEAKIDSGERFVIYVGRATCPYCHEYRQLQDKALGNLDETIYSVDTEYYMNNEKIAELRKNLDVEFVPDVVVIEDGKAVTHLPEDVQVSSVDGVTEWFEGVLN